MARRGSHSPHVAAALWAPTPVKACRLIAAQIPAFDRAMRSGAYRVRLGPMGRGGKTLRTGQERMLVGRHNEIHITPVGVAAGGSGGGKSMSLGKVILGVALVGTALISGGATLGLGAPALFAGTAAEISFGQIALFGASIALTGASQLLAGNPTVGRYEARESPEDRPSFLFNGGVNTVTEGPAIAWVWGKDVFVGSNVISAGIVNEQTGPKPAEPAVDGMLASFITSASGEVLA